MKDFLKKVSDWLSGHRLAAHFSAGLILSLYLSLYNFMAAMFLPFFFAFVKELVAAAVRSSRYKDGELSLRWGNIISFVLGTAVASVPIFILLNR